MNEITQTDSIILLFSITKSIRESIIIKPKKATSIGWNR